YIPVGYRCSRQPVMVRGGRFEVPGVDPDGKLRLYFYAGEKELGATVELSGQEATRGPVQVTLRPCGAATLRVVDDKGKAVEKEIAVHLELVVTPGGPQPDPWIDGSGLKDLAADTAQVGHHVPWAKEDGGRRTFRRLIPGATYRLGLPFGSLNGAPATADFV